MDRDGGQVRVVFGEDGVLATSDPGLIPLLDALVEAGVIAVAKPKDRPKEATT